MSNTKPYAKCIEEVRKLYNAYEEAVVVSVGKDKNQHIQITFTIIPRKKGDKE